MFSLATLVYFLALHHFGEGAPICPDKLAPCTCTPTGGNALFVMCANFDDTSVLTNSITALRNLQVHTLLFHGLQLKNTLPKGFFEGVKISVLKVEGSSLEFREPAFAGLDDSLENLDIAQNSIIKATDPFSFAPLSKLTHLKIKKNPISVVRNNLLNEKAPKLQIVILDDNNISLLENRAFANLTHLQNISVADNKITHVERNMLPRPAKELLHIDLCGNQIKSIPYDFFYDMPKLTKVILSVNDISTLPETTWKSIWERLDTVSLFENSLICDNRLDWMKNLNWPKNGVVALCVAPTRLSGKNLEDVYKT